LKRDINRDNFVSIFQQVANSVALGEEYALKLATIQSRTQEHQSLSQMIAFNKNNL